MLSLGTAIYIAVKPILKIYLILGIGFVLAKTNTVSIETQRGISNMVVNAILPCLFFNKIVTNISDSDIKSIGVIALTAIILFGFGGFLALVARYITPAPKQWAWGLIFVGLFNNISDLPIAYIQSLSGGLVFTDEEVEKGVAYSCIFAAFQTFCVMNLGMWRLIGKDFKQEFADPESTVETKFTPQTSTSAISDDEDCNVTDAAMRVVALRAASGEEMPVIARHSTNTSRRSAYSRRSSVSSRTTGMSHTDDVIMEYSEMERIRTGQLDLSKPLSITQEVGPATTHHIMTQDKKSFVDRWHLGPVVYIMVNFFRPASLGTVIGITVAMIPWVKALFVHTTVHVHLAPDKQPVLNFIMDCTSYVGNACIPLGLLMLGCTLGRLQVAKLPPGLFKTAILMTIFRLCVIPIVGVAWADKMYSLKWLDTNIGKLVFVLSFSMPSSTTQVYFTAFYSPLEGDHLQMDCLAVLILTQYSALFITVSVVVSYVLKVDLGL